MTKMMTATEVSTSLAGTGLVQVAIAAFIGMRERYNRWWLPALGQLS